MSPGKFLLPILIALIFSGIAYTQNPGFISKAEGLLIGSAIGDAAGGPVEFDDPPLRSFWSETDQTITDEGISEMAELFKLRQYPKDPEPYAQFEPYAPEGSVTDDTRWKMILINCIKDYDALTKENLARTYWDFSKTIPAKYDSICALWQEEYGYVMNYYLEKDKAYPPERVWGGIPTMAGQMPFLPMALLYPGDAEQAYIATWEINLLDVGYAKDITSVIVSGLNKALEPDASWEDVISTMKNTDPYNFAEVPWVPRKSTLWIDKAHELVERSNGVINELYRLLESELDAVTWWEAHVPLVVTLAFLEIVNYNPLAALQLCIEFGHDNDSYAQVIGAFAGAMYGKGIFDESMIKQVNNMMREQYNQDVGLWMDAIFEE